MNIFITDEDPTCCAGILSDQHIRSQLDESARILTTALSRKGITDKLLGKPCNLEDRSVLWADKDWDHFMWLVFHGMALVEEHERRFGFMHKASVKVFVAGNYGFLLCDHHHGHDLPAEWPRCEAAEGYAQYDVFNAYQNVLRDEYEAWADKNRGPTWTNTYPPQWLADTGEVLYTA